MVSTPSRQQYQHGGSAKLQGESNIIAIQYNV
jgi:hypothetical protein